MTAVFGAAALQAATGVGFGVIAGPILLLLLGDASAIQVSIVLNLLIACVLTPTLWRRTDIALLKQLVAGIAIGSPPGLLIFVSVDVELLKLGAGMAVLATLWLVLRDARRPSRGAPRSTTGSEPVLAGVLAGIMGVCLAMPGPLPAAWMAARGFNKDTIRATILAMFVVAYAIALGLQAGVAGIGSAVVRQSAVLVPATLLGVAGGHYLGRFLADRIFRWLLAAVLSATALGLLASLA